MPLTRTPTTAKGRLFRHVLAYNGARLLLVLLAATVIFIVDATTRVDVPVVLVLLIALGASLPVSAFVLRGLRRTINADIEAVDAERSTERRASRGGRTARQVRDHDK